jgi:DNA-binding Lrp family transcriptional regulator
VSVLKEQRKSPDPKRPKVTKELRLDEIDVRILQALQEDCRTPLEIVARELGIPSQPRIIGYRDLSKRV